VYADVQALRLIHIGMLCNTTSQPSLLDHSLKAQAWPGAPLMTARIMSYVHQILPPTNSLLKAVHVGAGQVIYDRPHSRPPFHGQKTFTTSCSSLTCHLLQVAQPFVWSHVSACTNVSMHAAYGSGKPRSSTRRAGMTIPQHCVAHCTMIKS
jgi:hypothetical protein